MGHERPLNFDLTTFNGLASFFNQNNLVDSDNGSNFASEISEQV